MVGNKELLCGNKGYTLPSQAGPLLTAPSGRQYYRHSSMMGSVMSFFDTEPRLALVLDARYRIGGLAFGALNNVYVPNIHLFPNTKNTKGNSCLAGEALSSLYDAASITDVQLNSLWAHVIDPNTSKFNCDAFLGYQSGSGALQYARSIVVDGQGCDVPNVQILMRMACDADFIDSMDQSLAQYPNNSLHIWFPANGGGNCWTSTQVLDGKAYENIYLDDMGWCSVGTWPRHQETSQVFPILELTA